MRISNGSRHRRIVMGWFVLTLMGCGEEVVPPVTTPPSLYEGERAAARYYGLQVGARWTFLRSGDVLRWKEITGCEDVFVPDPETGAPRIVRAYVRENRSESGTTSVHYLIEDDEGVKRVRRDDIDSGSMRMFATYDPPGPRIYNAPYPDGFTGTFTLVTGEFVPGFGNVSDGFSTTSAIDTVQGLEHVRLVAGEYDALAIERQWDAFNAHNVVSHYVDGIGEVRERTEWPTMPLPTVQIEELVAYSPGYASCDGRAPLFEAACAPPLLECANAWGNGMSGCTDPRVDPNNCGACGVTCPSGVCAGRTCVEPDCAIDCQGTTICCSNSWFWGVEGCTSPARDRWNCGGCGNICPGDQICDHGSCRCAEGTADCGQGACQDVLLDNNNCGGCGITCGGSTPICDKGICVGTCLSVDLVDCGDKCVDLAWDSDNCGACGVECGKGTGSTSCVEGVCIPCAQAGLTDCSGDCVDLRFSDNNCGACGIACAADQVCVSGQCIGGDGTCAMTCTDGDKICCQGECIDPLSNDQNCGGCGVGQCSGGCTEACRGGQCVPADCGGADD